MARPKAKAPSLRYHLSGQSVVTIDGKDYYLGKHDTPESIARYAVLMGIYQAGGLKLPSDLDLGDLDAKAAMLLGQIGPQASQQAEQPLLVRHVTASYREHIKTKYANNKAELHRLNQICDEADEHEGDRQADEYGPLALQRQRARWIAAGNSRVYCNRLCVAKQIRARLANSPCRLPATSIVPRSQAANPSGLLACFHAEQQSSPLLRGSLRSAARSSLGRNSASIRWNFGQHPAARSALVPVRPRPK